MSMIMYLKHADASAAASCQRGDVEKLIASDSHTLDLHKSWHLLHYLFTGSAWDGDAPAASLLHGGEEVGPDLGYGPARIISPDETASFAGFLASQTVEGLCARIDLAQMQTLDIYSAADGDDDDASEEIEEDVGHFFPQLQDHVAAAARDGKGLIVWLG